MKTSISDLDLQRLVDGELSDQQQQSLLSRLEQTDDWRRAALAFVEQQVWSASYHDVEDEIAHAPVAVNRQPVANTRSFNWLTFAATTVIAVGLGYFAGIRSGESDAAIPVIATDVPEREASPLDEQPVEPQPVMNLQLVSSDPDAEASLNIPVYDPSVTGYGFWDETPLFPEHVREQFSRKGYDVRQAREFYRIPLDDGSEIALPVDTVHVRYAGL